MNIAYCDNLIIYYEYVALLPCQGGGTATQSPAERFQSGSTPDLGFFFSCFQNPILYVTVTLMYKIGYFSDYIAASYYKGFVFYRYC